MDLIQEGTQIQHNISIENIINGNIPDVKLKRIQKVQISQVLIARSFSGLEVSETVTQRISCAPRVKM